MLSCATNLEDGGVLRFLDSAARAGLTVQVVGAGQAWQGWRWRMALYREALKAFDVGTVDTVVICDAYDVLVHPDARAKLDALLPSISSVLVGSESHCGNAESCLPISAWWRGRPQPWRRFANAGCIMGKRQSLIDMYTWILDQRPEIHDDQRGLCMWMNAGNGQLDEDEALVTNYVGYKHLLPWLPNSAFAHFPSAVTKYGFSLSYRYLCSRWSSLAPPPYFSGYSAAEKARVFRLSGVVILLLTIVAVML